MTTLLLTPSNDKKERIRLLADRLCYLNHGADGLRWRHGHQKSVGLEYYDAFDIYARQHFHEFFPEREPIPVVLGTGKPVEEPTEWKQLTLEAL